MLSICSLIMSSETLGSAYGLTGSQWGVWQWKVVVSSLITLWGAMTRFREQYFLQYVVLNLAVHVSTSVFSYIQHWIFIS